MTLYDRLMTAKIKSEALRDVATELRSSKMEIVSTDLVADMLDRKASELEEQR